LRPTPELAPRSASIRRGAEISAFFVRLHAHVRLLHLGSFHFLAKGLGFAIPASLPPEQASLPVRVPTFESSLAILSTVTPHLWVNLPHALPCGFATLPSPAPVWLLSYTMIPRWAPGAPLGRRERRHCGTYRVSIVLNCARSDRYRTPKDLPRYYSVFNPRFWMKR